LTTREQSGFVYCKTMPLRRNRRNPKSTSSSSSNCFRRSGNPIPCPRRHSTDREVYASTSLSSSAPPPPHSNKKGDKYHLRDSDKASLYASGTSGVESNDCNDIPCIPRFENQFNNNRCRNISNFSRHNPPSKSIYHSTYGCVCLKSLAPHGSTGY
jgi:hypothetical protein